MTFFLELLEYRMNGYKFCSVLSKAKRADVILAGCQFLPTALQRLCMEAENDIIKVKKTKTDKSSYYDGNTIFSSPFVLY